ncbi:MAG: AAA family ATPase [Methanobrevibacter sp.]|jgi:predicted AAA+ superfamily ATPase|nr:AAA family ATPase [Candidatus Methanoflexus mossambicus]
MYYEDEYRNFIRFKHSEGEKKIKKVKDFNPKEEYYIIKSYLDNYLNGRLEKRFLALPGLRGVGKTTILFQLYDYLLNKKNISSNNIFYISFDQFRKYFQTDILEIVNSFLKEIHNIDMVDLDEQIFIFIDEVHLDKTWGDSGKIIFDTTDNIFLICTGSSALDLEISGDVARRLDKKYIFPNNFKDSLMEKHNISINSDFSTALKELIYLGDDNSLKKAIALEKKVENSLKLLNKNPKYEFESFLKTQGFPSTLNFSEIETYEDIYSRIENIINKDISSIKSFNLSTASSIEEIIYYLGLQAPGGTSTYNIANYISIGQTTVKNILDVLEKTQLLFSILPYGSGGKIIKKPRQYFFLSPSIKAAINYNVGRFDLMSRKCLGALAETLVASGLYKMTKTSYPVMKLFYPPDKGSSDFLIKVKLNDLIPIEIGVGKKTKSHLTKDINKYGSEYGILISNRYSKLKKENNIIYIPLMYIGFI